jgi:hypothetical protein
MSQRWCVYIDILGFSEVWESEQPKALAALRQLMQSIYRIGTRAYPHEGERLFVHHVGDGFAIASEFREASLERPISIAIALMRCVASVGMYAAAAIAEGDLADITGCYPSEVVQCSKDNRVSLGAGIMTLSSVMGTAFIRAYRLSHHAPSGPLITIPFCYRDRIPVTALVRETEWNGGQLLSVDWLRAELPSLPEIQQIASLCAPTSDALAKGLTEYLRQNAKLRPKWGHACNLLGIVSAGHSSHARPLRP